MQILATCDDDRSTLRGKVEQKERCALVNWSSGCRTGLLGGVRQMSTARLFVCPGLWQLCQVAMGVRIFSLFNRALQDPVGSQVEMDFGALLWVSPTIWFSFTEHATTTEEWGSFLVSYPILEAWCTSHYKLYRCPRAMLFPVSACVGSPQSTSAIQRCATACSHVFLYQLWVRTKKQPMSPEQRLVTSWCVISASSKEATAQNGSDLREHVLQKHAIIFGCPQLHWRGTEPVEAGMEVQGYALPS